jgi:hypothetical protein
MCLDLHKVSSASLLFLKIWSCHLYPNKTAAINLFIRKISEIDEAEYGDFMRKANLYLNILISTLFRYSPPKVKKILQELQFIIQYQPNWDIEKTLPQIYARANLIKKYYVI